MACTLSSENLRTSPQTLLDWAMYGLDLSIHEWVIEMASLTSGRDGRTANIASEELKITIIKQILNNTKREKCYAYTSIRI